MWLVLNYSDYMNQRLASALEETCPIQRPCGAMQLLPHLFILSTAMRNWQSYIEMLRQKLARYEMKAYSSRIDETYLEDYKILFADIQESTALNDMVMVAKAVIIKQKDVLAKCTDLHSSLHGRGYPAIQCDIASTLAKMKTDLQHEHGELTALAQGGSMISQLLSNIVAIQTTNGLQESITSIGSTIKTIQVQSSETNVDIDHLQRIVTGGQKDAQKVKLMAQVATMFLPASLVASLFSSTIFCDSGSNITYIGLYFAITIPLLFVTLLLLVLIEKESAFQGNQNWQQTLVWKIFNYL
ncbi:hypothetical protein F5Y18DRAFT_392255 [Xylariaceae sp. FL1019]|nr:hypothetical protein F5Y18DRAFT_392255 [Xylariaceae sp. FL1019]